MPPKKAFRTKSSTPTTPPTWPPLHPRLASEKQRLTSLLSSQIITTPLFPIPLAATYRSFLASLPLTVVPQTRKKDHALRLNDRFSVQDPAFAAQLWSSTGLSDLVTSGLIDGENLSEADRTKLWGGEPIGLNPNIRVYRYREGHYFEKHYDEENLLPFELDKADGSKEKVQGRTTWTLLIYLSGPATGCEGGETVFYPEDESMGGFGKGSAKGNGIEEMMKNKVVASMEVGMALLHKHGRDCLLHEGRQVKNGEKWVIRSDLVVKR
ncbi:hypothetical protein BDZ85DRAFT_94886 [Elsinoe ampelina]|uniref:Prolyl 4-hydroxylase alpha subunit domain-containing protein n=1 Tax=Elsinoe ampelina TaxID=302913 RepID=A0A6A6GEI6_9PEZI|nr:hypothetical protein BDZ85DRAFT_94886 [Elsinoe ampelina]